METRRGLFGRIKDAFVTPASREPSFCLACERIDTECECTRSSGVSRRFFLMSAAAVAVPIPETTWASLSPEPIILGVSTPYGPRLITPDWVTREALAILENNLTLCRMVNREYDGFVQGAVINIRKPRRFR